MWVMLPFGFYSIGEREPTTDQPQFLIVNKKVISPFVYNNKDFLCVRSRDRNSLSQLIEHFHKEIYGRLSDHRRSTRLVRNS